MTFPFISNGNYFPQLKSSTTAESIGSSSSITFNAPTNLVEGDLLVCVVGFLISAGGNFDSLPSGWSVVAQNVLSDTDAALFPIQRTYNFACFSKTITASEPSTYTFSNLGLEFTGIVGKCYNIAKTNLVNASSGINNFVFTQVQNTSPINVSSIANKIPLGGVDLDSEIDFYPNFPILLYTITKTVLSDVWSMSGLSGNWILANTLVHSSLGTLLYIIEPKPSAQDTNYNYGNFTATITRTSGTGISGGRGGAKISIESLVNPYF